MIETRHSTGIGNMWGGSSTRIVSFPDVTVAFWRCGGQRANQPEYQAWVARAAEVRVIPDVITRLGLLLD